MMLFLVRRGVWSRSLHLCTRRSISKASAFTIRNLSKDASFQSQWPTCNFNTRLSFVGRHASSARFFSRDGSYSDFEDKAEGNLSSLLPSVQTCETTTTTAQSRRLSPFLDQLRRCGSPLDVLDLTCKTAPTPRQVSNCLAHMWFTVKKFTEEQRLYELQLMVDHPAFDRLLQTSMKTVVHMNTEDIAHSLLAMVNLGIPQRSRVVQVFLRHSQEKLNDFDEKSLSVLAACLANMEETASVAALKEGIRMLVEMRLPEIKGVLSLQTIMRMLGKDIPVELKRKLERKALSMTDQFSLPNTQHMISIMATMDFHSKPLLDVCSKKILANLYGIPFTQLLIVLLSCKKLSYRDLELLTGISDYVGSVNDIWTNKQFLLLLSAFERLAFCPDAIMEAFAQKVIGNPDALTLKDLLCVLKVYSSLNYDLKDQRQVFLDSVTQILCSYLPKMSAFELLRSVYYLSVFGCFPAAPLQQLMNEDTINQLKTTAPRLLRNQTKMLQRLLLCLRLDSPAHAVPLTLPSFPLEDTAAISQPTAKPWLSQSLSSLLEEQENTVLQTKVLVENFYLIDAVVTKHSVSQSSVHGHSAGDELSPGASSQRIALISASNGCCWGTSRPRGPLVIMTRHLKILGYECILLMDQELQAMSEPDRVDLLRSWIFPESHRPESLTQ